MLKGTNAKQNKSQFFLQNKMYFWIRLHTNKLKQINVLPIDGSLYKMIPFHNDLQKKPIMRTFTNS